MSPFTETVVVIAALLYIFSRLGGVIKALNELAISRSVQKLDELRQATHQELKPSFDLWWENGPRQTVSMTLQQTLPDEIVSEASELIEELISLPLRAVEQNAWRLALHTYEDGAMKDLIAKLPRIGGIRARLAERHMAIQEELEEVASQLPDYGINVAELEAHFAPSR